MNQKETSEIIRSLTRPQNNVLSDHIKMRDFIYVMAVSYQSGVMRVLRGVTGQWVGTRHQTQGGGVGGERRRGMGVEEEEGREGGGQEV